MQQPVSKEDNPLGHLPIPQLLAKYAVPSIISMVVMSLYNIVDQIFIGRGPGYLGNAATTVAFPLTTIMLALCLLVGNGSAAFISLELGRGNGDKARQILGNAVTLLLGLSVILLTVGLMFLHPILLALGATPGVYDYARDYTSVIIMGAPFAMLGTGLTNIIRADGSPRYSMMFTLAGALLNVVLDPILITTLQMGVRGAAIATVFSQFISAAFAMYYIIRKGNFVRLSFKGMRPIPSMILRIAAIGSSSFVTQISLTVINILLNRTITYYGALSSYGSDIPLAAAGVVMKINAILTSFVLGIAVGAQPILGFNYGAGRYDRVRRTLKIEIIAATGCSTFFCLLFLLAPQFLISFFGDTSGDFNEFAARFLRTYLSCSFIIGIQIPSSNYFQAVGKPLKSMVLSMSRNLILLAPLMLLLPLFFGLDGILYAGPSADILSVLVSGSFLLWELRRLGRPPEDPPEGAAAT